MEEEYNWKLILAASVPVAMVEAYIFYNINISNAWKWVLLIAGMALSAGIIYTKDKRKSNIFTAASIVLLAALVVKFARAVGLL